MAKINIFGIFLSHLLQKFYIFQSNVQDKDEIKDTIKQISNGGHRSLKLGGEKEKCVGSCTKPSVHEGCKYGVNCQVLIIFFTFHVLLQQYY